MRAITMIQTRDGNLFTTEADARRRQIETIQYGQYTWNTQWYTPTKDDWSSSEYSYEGDIVIGANCGHCEASITQYLLKRAQRYPEDTTPGDFVHDVTIPHGAPLSRRSQDPVRQASDKDLMGMIERATTYLGCLLDEREERLDRNEWKPGVTL